MLLKASGIHMSYTPENRAELEVLMLYQSVTNLDGIKIHKNADPSVIAAAERLFEGGFISQIDGGYLTPLGCTAAEHAHLLFDILNARIDG